MKAKQTIKVHHPHQIARENDVEDMLNSLRFEPTKYIRSYVFWLVVWIPLKNMKVRWDDDIPNIWKKCSKPPTSYII